MYVPGLLNEREKMNLETLAIENQDLHITNQVADCGSDQTAQVTPMSVECFKLVGGGSSIFLFD